MDNAILGLDIGTTSAKAVLYSLSGDRLASAERAYRLYTPQPRWVEQDPEELWQALLYVLRTVVDHAIGQQRTPKVALALACQSGSLLPASRHGTPVAPIVTWMDSRTEELAFHWRAEGIEAQVRAISGWHLNPGQCLLTIAWLRQHQPAVFADAEHFFSVNDFLIYRLTGSLCTNPSNGGGMQLVDMSSGEWSSELCGLAGIEPEQLSPILPSGAVVGHITPEVSRLTGLPTETVVINGGHDQGCTALSLGVTAPGRVLVGSGTAWVITGVTDTPDLTLLPESLDLNFLPMPPSEDAPRCWTVSQLLGGLGASLDWLLQRCWLNDSLESGTARADAFASLDAKLDQTTPGGNGLFFLPMTGGPSALAGEQRGGFLGLRLSHSRADMARAIMEGAAYELRWALQAINLASVPVKRIWLIGGATQSPLWPSIVADVTGLPLCLPQGTDWPAAGAAILAGAGSSVFKTLAAAQARFEKPALQMEPDPLKTGTYNEHFLGYQQLSSSLTGCLDALTTKKG